jgi:superfamily II helicase
LIADRARFRIAKRIERLAGYRLPDRAFNGTMLEALSSGINFDAFDFAVREQLLAFFNDFLRCTCRDSPLCGCPEKKFAQKVLELRENGLDHRQISAFLLDEYGIEIFPADILSFLEDSVHVLEAISDISRLKGRKELAKKTDDHIRLIER